MATETKTLERLQELMLTPTPGAKDELEKLHQELLELVLAGACNNDRETIVGLHERIRRVYCRVAAEYSDDVEVSPIFNLGRLAGVLEILGWSMDFVNPAELDKLLKEEGGKEILAALRVDEACPLSKILEACSDHSTLPDRLACLQASGVILVRRMPEHGVMVTLTPLGKQALEQAERTG